MTAPIMPKATAKWLVFNTTMTFDQIADFTQLHALEVQSIADDETAQHMKGVDPVLMGQLTREEIAKAEADPAHRLKLLSNPLVVALQKPRKGARYTPVSKRLEKPDAIFWLIRNHPELPDAVIGRLVGTTKATIDKVRNRTHWNATNLKASDPVTLGLCTQIELDQAIEKANREKTRSASSSGARNTLRPAKETLAETDEVDPFADELEAEAETNEGGLDADEPETDGEDDES
ncbi:hypothetical protein sos41_35550 [Alphaproteobacteria bacterium SO-S41]|nr:hypothetical protein sos41_35550 [Alphaproteobacteria bacterium SO-S41]